jgi:hypothetical protein
MPFVSIWQKSNWGLARPERACALVCLAAPVGSESDHIVCRDHRPGRAAQTKRILRTSQNSMIVRVRPRRDMRFAAYAGRSIERAFSTLTADTVHPTLRLQYLRRIWKNRQASLASETSRCLLPRCVLFCGARRSAGQVVSTLKVEQRVKVVDLLPSDSYNIWGRSGRTGKRAGVLVSVSSSAVAQGTLCTPTVRTWTICG